MTKNKHFLNGPSDTSKRHFHKDGTISKTNQFARMIKSCHAISLLDVFVSNFEIGQLYKNMNIQIKSLLA